MGWPRNQLVLMDFSHFTEEDYVEAMARWNTTSNSDSSSDLQITLIHAHGAMENEKRKFGAIIANARQNGVREFGPKIVNFWDDFLRAINPVPSRSMSHQLTDY